MLSSFWIPPPPPRQGTGPVDPATHRENRGSDSKGSKLVASRTTLALIAKHVKGALNPNNTTAEKEWASYFFSPTAHPDPHLRFLVGKFVP